MEGLAKARLEIEEMMSRLSPRRKTKKASKQETRLKGHGTQPRYGNKTGQDTPSRISDHATLRELLGE